MEKLCNVGVLKVDLYPRFSGVSVHPYVTVTKVGG